MFPRPRSGLHVLKYIYIQGLRQAFSKWCLRCGVRTCKASLPQHSIAGLQDLTVPEGLQGASLELHQKKVTQPNFYNSCLFSFCMTCLPVRVCRPLEHNPSSILTANSQASAHQHVQIARLPVLYTFILFSMFNFGHSANCLNLSVPLRVPASTLCGSSCEIGEVPQVFAATNFAAYCSPVTPGSIFQGHT